MDCARLMRGSSSRLNAVIPCAANDLTVSAWVAGWRKLINTAPFFRREISLSRGACTFSTASASCSMVPALLATRAPASS